MRVIPAQFYYVYSSAVCRHPWHQLHHLLHPGVYQSLYTELFSYVYYYCLHHHRHPSELLNLVSSINNHKYSEIMLKGVRGNNYNCTVDTCIIVLNIRLKNSEHKTLFFLLFTLVWVHSIQISLKKRNKFYLLMCWKLIWCSIIGSLILVIYKIHQRCHLLHLVFLSGQLLFIHARSCPGNIVRKLIPQPTCLMCSIKDKGKNTIHTKIGI